ncbi:DUF2267 domain-containing protein [Vulgatibacter sp.]|uniref:DUF2267 domain-containing protein n=1 Tax=Vulgatibacter sp. TaxID=1971226 RepID=UPI0035658B38
MAEGYIEGAHSAGPGMVRLHESAEELLRDVEASGALPEGVTAEAAVSGVLCTLAMRLTGGEASNFFASLPDGIRPLLRTCTLHQDQAAQLFDKPAFIRKVAHHFGLGDDDAEPIARAVLRATRARIPTGELHGVEGQLPKDLKELWTHG